MIYFVSYNWWTSRQKGSGSIEITLDYPIRKFSDIKLIKKYIEENVKDKYGEYVDACVMNYILLEATND